MNQVRALALTVAAVACSTAPDHATNTPMPDLTASLDAARAAFNAHPHEVRFLTLLSPT